jgi:transcriptional regulator with XRE-family HTH domain
MTTTATVQADEQTTPATPAAKVGTYTITANLGDARKNAGISLAKAARHLNVSETSVKSLERSKSPQLSSIARYAAMIGVHPSTLLSYELVAETPAELARDEEAAEGEKNVVETVHGEITERSEEDDASEEDDEVHTLKQTAKA